MSEKKEIIERGEGIGLLIARHNARALRGRRFARIAFNLFAFGRKASRLIGGAS